MTANAFGLKLTAANDLRGPAPVLTVLFPLIAFVVATLVSRHYGAFPAMAGDQLLTVGSAVASVGGTMLGFMLAALAVLASINDTHLVRMMKTTGHYKDLLATLFVGAVVYLACVAFGYALLFGAVPNDFMRAALVGIHAAALVSLVEIGRKFWLVLANLRSSP